MGGSFGASLKIASLNVVLELLELSHSLSISLSLSLSLSKFFVLLLCQKYSPLYIFFKKTLNIIEIIKISIKIAFLKKKYVEISNLFTVFQKFFISLSVGMCARARVRPQLMDTCVLAHKTFTN